jgi:phenylalanyl-tRNA synthetase beta chain
VRLLVSWLRDLVDVPVAPAQLAADLHMTGFEVASVEPPPGITDTSADAVIDFEITANRPDCLSVIGLAREVATRYGTALHPPEGLALGPPDAARTGTDLAVAIDEPGPCARYCAAVADVRVGPSPDWLRGRLEAAGVRAINNIVDVTNYVLLELGHPMHAFDLARLAGAELHVRLAHRGERLRTLDGQDRTLQPDMLVIADGRHATALAGVMGGAGSEVTSSTRTVAFESAWFDPASVRRTGRRLGLSTEASYRFERGADIEAPPTALARACALMEQIGAGTVRRPWIDAWPLRKPARRVPLESARVEQVLGIAVGDADIDRILTGLGFGVEMASPGRFEIVVPSWRVDVSRDVDLVEEVARHVGYDRLPTTFPALTAVPATPDRRRERDRLVRRVAAAGGFTESVTFSFIPRDRAAAFADGDTLVEILNPLSEQFAVLRPSLLPGLVESVAHNRRRGQDDVQLFELGTVFGVGAGERRALGVAWTGSASRVHWSGPARAVDFFDVKGFVEALARAVGSPVTFAPAQLPFLVPGRAAAIETAGGSEGGRRLGSLGLILPSLADSYDLPARAEVYVAEIDLDEMLDVMTFDATLAVQSPPRHPVVVRDISIVVEDTLPAADVRGTIRAAAPATLVRVGEFDRYQGKGVPDGRVSLSYRLTFQAADRTLTDAEVQRAMEEILASLARVHGAVQR